MTQNNSLTKKMIVAVMAILILIPGAFGFGHKLVAFFLTLASSRDGRFALVPIAAYLLVSLGFLFIFIWGLSKGMLSDIEGPKYRMLERERELDEMEGEPRGS